MKAKKKPRGTKARVQASKTRLAYIGTAITVAILIAIVAISSFLIYSSQNPSPDQTSNPDQTNNPTSQLKAAIVDHLSLSAPNKTFIQTATNILKEAGYTVDYYPGEEVNVTFYRNLPTHGYGLIVLRVHSAINPYRQYVTLFTSEPYSQTKYFYDQFDDRVGILHFLPYNEGDPEYFGIPPRFIEYSTNGRLQNTLIIMMGCSGLTYTSTAEAFIKKGAKVYISWSGNVLSSHTDQATTQLLQHLITDKQTIKQAVTETMKEVGPDPAYKSILLYYPPETGEQTTEDITGKP